MMWLGVGTPAPATPDTYTGKHRRPRPISVDEAAIPTVYLNDVVRHMRSDALTLDPTRLGPGFDIDDAMQRAGDDADDALTAWRTSMSTETTWAAYVNEHANDLRMGTTATHKLGDISRDTADFFWVEDEFESEYVGRWVTGFGYVGVVFPKATSRPLTVVEFDWLATHEVGLS